MTLLAEQTLGCRNDANVEKPIVLPMEAPFVLFPTDKSRTCQRVAGMNATLGSL